MDHTNEGVLKLLQDIKEILLGIALLLLGGILAGLGIGLAGLTGGGVFLLLPVAGFLILLNGGLHVWYGWTAHHVVEKIDDAEGAER
ncbi:MAG: hypothetical protein HFG10_00880 [Oscillibacter sp.]|jgi:hypothetical protein|nr:hypothetical protein [Oscillibacter sp.]